MNSGYNQDELVNDIKVGCQQAFNYLYCNYSTALLIVINSYTDDSHIAEDLLQDSFVSIWLNINQYDPKKGSLYTWMRNIAKNKALDYFKCSVSIMRTKTHTAENSLELSRQVTEVKTDQICLSKRLLALSPVLGNLVYLVYYKGHTMEEVAKTFKTPLGTVKTRMRRALQLLRDDFEFALHTGSSFSRHHARIL